MVSSCLGGGYVIEIVWQVHVDNMFQKNAAHESLFSRILLEYMEVANAGGKEYLYCKHDGSLDDGFEMVTHPMTLDFHMPKMPWEQILDRAIRMKYQSRSDFILYNGELYMFHAPINREHIGILHIDRTNLASSSIVLQAHMQSSCFYPFVQYFDESGLAMSCTVARQHIRLGRFSMEKYI